MYGNVNTQIAFELTLPAIEGDGDLYLDTSVSYPGVRFATDLVFVNMSNSVLADTARLLHLEAYIAADDEIVVRAFKPSGEIAIPAGTKLRGIILRCDNGFIGDGL